ncbi:MAG: hypothetical protein NXI18_21675 [Alphaproteobacteria bacterium]|nr:hypothetical protein [Alphaproteobacteria bacterium]
MPLVDVSAGGDKSIPVVCTFDVVKDALANRGDSKLVRVTTESRTQHNG